MQSIKMTFVLALAAACAVLSAEGMSTKTGLKAGAAFAAIGAGMVSQVVPGVIAAGLWAPPQHHDHHSHHDEHHGHHGHHDEHDHHHGHHHHQHGISHGHGHGYNEFGWASLPSPVVNIGHLLRTVALPPIHEVLPRVHVALPQLHGHLL